MIVKDQRQSGKVEITYETNGSLKPYQRISMALPDLKVFLKQRCKTSERGKQKKGETVRKMNNNSKTPKNERRLPKDLVQVYFHYSVFPYINLSCY